MMFKGFIHLWWISLAVIFWSCGGKEIKNDVVQPTLKWDTVSVDAPFDMPPLVIPNFEQALSFDISDFGAIQGQDASQAIADAIDSCASIGGGRVIVPEGEWLTGKVHLKSNVNLHVAKGAVLLFSDNPDDYLPAVKTSWEGMECYNYSPLIYAYECENVAVTGEGTLKAKMGTWEQWFGRPPAHKEALKKIYHAMSKGVSLEERQMAEGENHFRPHFIQFNRCKHVLVEGVTIRNSPFWTIHPYLSDNVVIRGVDILAHGHNNDGVDPEMSRNMLIENCSFDQGDDAVAIKAGRNLDGWRLESPTENLVIRNCTVANGHQFIAIGSELSGGIRKVYVHDCKSVHNRDTTATNYVKHGMQNIMLIKTNERRGGFVDSIFVENIKATECSSSVLSINTDVLYQWRDLVPTYEELLTSISNIFMKNISVHTLKRKVMLKGDEAKPIRNVTLENIQIDQASDTSIVLNVEDVAIGK